MRKAIPKSVETEVLINSRRRCCLCVFLSGRDEVRKGQIAHLSQDAEDSQLENLVWLCLEHHDEFDSRTSQAKGLTSDEVREYRDRLYAINRSKGVSVLGDDETARPVNLSSLKETSEYEAMRRQFSPQLDFVSNPWRFPIFQVANEPELFAYKAGNRADGVCLIERVDLPDGRIVVAAIEIAGNPGLSITNAVEELCFQVCQRFNIPAERLIWLEHYDYDEDSSWNMVTFARQPPDRPFEEPEWTEMTPRLWRHLRLKPKKVLSRWRGHFRSKLQKRFDWPTEALLSFD
jgi:hypothetical protein